MNELMLYKAERKIMSPFCEITFKLENGAEMEDFIESLEYWGVKYRDMEKECSDVVGMFERKRAALGY